MFAHGARGRRIDSSWWTHWAISRSSQCSTWYVLSCLCDGAYKRTLAANRKVKPMWRQRVSSLAIELSFTMCLTPYMCKQNVFSASLNKIFPSFRTTGGWGTGWYWRRSVLGQMVDFLWLELFTPLTARNGGGGGGGGGKGGLNYLGVHISIEGWGTPSTRPETGTPV